MQSTIKNFEDFLKYEKNYSSHTVKAYINDIEDFFSFIDTNFKTPFDKIKTKNARFWVMDMLDRKIQPRSANRKLSSLKRFYKYLQFKEIIESNPFQLIPNIKISKKINIPYSENEANTTFFSWESENGDFEDTLQKTIIKTLYFLGLRISELINIKENDIDFSRGMIKILGKGNKERLLPIESDLQKILENYLKEKSRYFLDKKVESNHLFNTLKGKKLYPLFIWRLTYSKMSNHTTKEKNNPHLLRHTFATHLLNQGANIMAVKDLMGHASIAATQVYAHSDINKLIKEFGNSHPRAKKK